MLEGINADGVTQWLRSHVPVLESPVKFTLITGGHSNLTYRCEDSAGNAYVLRRPPLGHVLESAHDMGREHKIIAALAKTAVPVLGVPVQSKALNGLDSLLSIVQMPAGVPVATFAIGKAGATNAALFAVSILATTDDALRAKLDEFRTAQTQAVLDKPDPRQA